MCICCLVGMYGIAEAEEIPPSSFKIAIDKEFNINDLFIVKVTKEELIKKEEEFVKQQELQQAQEEARKSDNGVIIEQERHKLGRNCVSFVRDEIESLPQNLWTLEDKENIINAYEPETNDVVITDEGNSGHVAIVREVLDDTIVIEEGNFITGYKTKRIIPKELPIGYWRAS